MSQRRVAGEIWSEASRIVDLLMSPGVPDHVGFSEHLHVLDLQRDLRWFMLETRLAQAFGVFPVVTLADGTQIPISIVFESGIGPDGDDGIGSEDLPKSASELRTAQTPFGKVQLVQISEAISLVKEQANSFLRARMMVTRDYEAGMDFDTRLEKKHMKSGCYTTPVCSVTFHTVSPGLRIVRSGAYFITGTPRAVGAPTTPLGSTLPPGTYLFGADQGKYGSAVQWDTAHYSIPATSTIHLSF